MHVRSVASFGVVGLLAVTLLAACGAPREAQLVGLADLEPAGLAAAEKLQVVVTTSLIGDVVTNVAGSAADVEVLLSRGADPHSYELTSQDLRSLGEAHVIIINGLGLEDTLLETVQQAAGGVPIISLSQGIEPLTLAEAEADDSLDPHVWFDPERVQVWAETTAAALRRLDPAAAEQYDENAVRYQAELAALDGWIMERVAVLESEQRRLVTDHDSLGYFAERYDFEIVGAVVPGYSTAAEPSAGELAALIKGIEALGARAIFVDASIDPALAEQVARETGAVIVPIYAGSLSEGGGPAGDYLSFMRFNVENIVSALQ